MNRILTRLIELLVAAVGALIAALSFWTAYDTFMHPPESTSRTALWIICYLIVFVACALTVFVIRMAFPRFRVEGNRVVGSRGVLAFAVLYGVTILIGIISSVASR